jgi:hypothetical protein
VKESLTGHLNPAASRQILRLHRLIAFEEAFTGYLEGRTSAEQVKVRARKMLSIGLPRLK